VYKKNAKKRENEPARIEWNGGQMHRVCLQILLREALKYVCQKKRKKKKGEKMDLKEINEIEAKCTLRVPRNTTACIIKSIYTKKSPKKNERENELKIH